ncbi:hypothetical protein N5923_09130 [Erwiniaceae bacterium BAC15a-03b]|uniref:Uncharacterized protein n=1 Tax=Winslowiella arboricola TaxID=2978220 RepID=A0A9J6PLL2_9GAMM|nr:hypothetical protein [Winslowiella arboricola]MCU5773744.1 hypothetical protein [Winslowiella arboricola]MCU5777654.1 hypothetical protein [Winslowiella arboricola]
MKIFQNQTVNNVSISEQATVNSAKTQVTGNITHTGNQSASLQRKETAITIDSPTATESIPAFRLRIWKKLVTVRNFIQCWGLNQFILQLGPQIKVGDVDLKFTPTLVLLPDSLSFYPVHTEVGLAFDIGSSWAKGYALVVKQFGIEYNFNSASFSYNRQQLARVECDIPALFAGLYKPLQLTLALEVGTTNKTTTLGRSLQHAIQDLTTIAPAKAILLAQAYNQAGIIGPLIGLLGTSAILDGLIDSALPGTHERDSSLWFGFCLGYADLNQTLIPDINKFDNDKNGVNLITAFYSRHMQAMTLDLHTRDVIVPPIIKLLFGHYYKSTIQYVSDALKARGILSQELREKVNQGIITPPVQQKINEVSDQVIAALYTVVDEGINGEDDASLKVAMEVINSSFQFIYNQESPPPSEASDREESASAIDTRF